MKIDWVRKLASRKFQLAVVTFITSMLVLFNVSEVDIVKITAVITNALVVMAYIFAEGYVDGKYAEAPFILDTTEFDQE